MRTKEEIKRDYEKAEADNELRFLVQRVDRCTGERFNSVMDIDMLIHYIDMQDCCDEEYKIFDISNLGIINQVFYAGWKPNCLIEIVDINGDIIASGYGTDH